MECSYCIIPYVRPALSSRNPEDVLAETRRLVDRGHREIVLVGIHLGHYGLEQGAPGMNLAQLVRRVAELDGDFRIRISSLEAAEVSPELIRTMADHPERVCPHLHIPLQSGSDRVLGRMRRRWPVQRLIERCREVCEALDRPALTSDVIVGFPGESEEDFAATCRAVEEAGFSKLHVFRFSPRQGTPAAELPDRVPGFVQQRRAAALAALGERLRQRYFESLLGRTLQVLVEAPAADRPGTLRGTSDRYAPVELPGGEELIGRLTRVREMKAVGGVILGKTASAGCGLSGASTSCMEFGG